MLNLNLNDLSLIGKSGKNIPTNQVTCSLCYNIAFNGKKCNNRKCKKVFCNICMQKQQIYFLEKEKKEFKCPFCMTFSSFSELDQNIIDYISSFKYLCKKNKNCKGQYTLEELIKEQVSPEYEGGTCIIYRLEPKDYHHYIFNDDGIILSNKKINGKLHTVNPIVYDKYKVFTENKREVTTMKTTHLDNIIQIEVGALCVGRIKNREVMQFERYEEKGYFEFGGSTIIQLFKKGIVDIDQEILNNTKEGIETQVTVGKVIGRVIK